MKLPVPLLAALMLSAPLAHAKLPPPSPEAAAKADEAKAKAAWNDKVGAFQLCRAMDRVAETYRKSASAAAASAPKAALPTPPCSDPGPFIAAAPAASKPIEASGAHSPPSTAGTPPSVSPATQTQLQGAKK